MLSFFLTHFNFCSCIIWTSPNWKSIQLTKKPSTRETPPPPPYPNEKQDKTKEWNQLISIVKGKSFAYIYTCIFFSSSNTKIQERKKKNKRPSHPPLPPLQNLNWSLHVQNKKSIFTENQNKKPKQTNLKELGSEWPGGIWESRGRKAGPGEECGIWPHRVQASLSASGAGEHHTREAMTITPPQEWLLQGCGSETAAQATVGVFCVSTISPSHSCSNSHTHTHRHTRTCFGHCGSVYLWHIVGALEEKRYFLQVRVHCPIPCRLWSHAIMPASSQDVFPQMQGLTLRYECGGGQWVTKLPLKISSPLSTSPPLDTDSILLLAQLCWCDLLKQGKSQ
jgi:hypothetical protein